MSDEDFAKLLIKVEAERFAVQSFVHVLVQRLARDCGLDVEMLLEHLHILQSHLPGLDGIAGERQALIGKEVLSAFGSLIKAVDDAAESLKED